MSRLRRGVPVGEVVLVSGFDPAAEGRGGIFAWDGSALTRVDARCTTGMRRHRGSLIRCLWNDSRRHADLVVVDEQGRSWRSRIDGVGNPHDVLGDGDLAAVVATEQNEIAWFRADGSRARTWRPGGEPDSWHLNSLVEHDGRLLVCAFGRFFKRKEWDASGRPASGCVVDVSTGEVVLDGLRAPHTPRHVDGRWLVCNSADGELLGLDESGGREVLARFEGWPRGLAVTATAIHVGVSPPRHAVATRAATSRLVTLDRTSFAVLAEVEVPAREVYDLELVPAAMVDALRAGAAADDADALTPYRDVAGF